MRLHSRSGHVYVDWAGQSMRRQGDAKPIVRSGHIETGDRILEAARVNLHNPIGRQAFGRLCNAITALPRPTEFIVQGRSG